MGRSIATKQYGHILVVVPSVDDLLVPKLSRRELRDVQQAQWAVDIGIVSNPSHILQELSEHKIGFLDRINRRIK